jgi:hypothetical protein
MLPDTFFAIQVSQDSTHQERNQPKKPSKKPVDVIIIV